MKKFLAAAVLLLTMAACGGARHDLTLEGTTWKLSRMDGIPSSALDRQTDDFTLSFNRADTLVSGRTNCNRFFGKYMARDGKLSLTNMGMTRMACPDMQYEDAFVRMLDRVDRYEIHGSELKLYNDRTVLAVFRADDRNDANRRDDRDRRNDMERQNGTTRR